MTKNIIIYSDGTGQRGGLLLDERRTNVYKMFRATRSGPDVAVDARKQAAFYDPGIGSAPGNIGTIAGLGRFLVNLASQATGLGIDKNITDCYAALIKLHRPGDRIFLIGFSRGAYTIRCLSGVIALCGIPTRGFEKAAPLYDDAKLRRIAEEGVKGVYSYTSSHDPATATPRQLELLEQRKLLAKRFREKYGSGHEEANAHPYFIGAFDTVASLMNPGASALLGFMSVGLLALLAWILSWFGQSSLTNLAALAISAIATTVLLLILPRLRWARGLPRLSWWKTVHFTSPRRKFNDVGLNPSVEYARHAISIDERRETFSRVPWGRPGVWQNRPHSWFKQVWFAGNHSDVGGSYPENESRLSDIALEWMVGEAIEVGLHVDPSYLRPSPDPEGPQHDESVSLAFRFAGKLDRRIKADAVLHPTVLKRLAADEVLQIDRYHPYRPENLRKHKAARRFYEQGGGAAPPAKQVQEFSDADWAKKAPDGASVEGVAKLED
jgi:hypothetical protein